MNKEPVLSIIGLGTLIAQSVMQILIGRGVEIGPVEQAAWTTLVTATLAFWARSQVTPVASLPPGVAGVMADRKAAALAEK